MNIRKTTLLFSLALALFVGGLSSVSSNHASAAYNGARIIDNGVFLNANSMNTAQIQSFLASKGSGLASRSFVMQCSAAGSTANQLYVSAGAPCNQNTSAANIIYFASRIYGVNPQVILATIQKEQSLVTTGNPTVWQLTQAMGYGCPTTGSCDTSSSFFYQIDNGTWALRYHYERANGNNTWWSPSSSWVCGTEKNFYKPNLYPGQNVRFYDGNNVNYRTYFIENAATSAFYCYTPHAYNNPQGLYGRPAFGTVGQYYSGSYNFVSSFEEWFGPTQMILPGCDEATYTTLVCIWRLRSPTGAHVFPTSVEERNQFVVDGYTYEGKAFIGKNPVAPSSGNIPVYRVVSPGGKQLITASAVERNSLIGAGWQDRGISFYADPSGSNSGYATYRMYSSSTGNHVWTTNTAEVSSLQANGYVSEGEVFSAISPLRQEQAPTSGQMLVYRFGSMPGNGHFWTTSINERDELIRANYQYEGVAWNSSSTTTSAPVYRLYSPTMQKHHYTTDLNEKNVLASTSYWRYEGISQYMSPVSNSKPVYRMYSPITTRHLWTTSANERDTLVQRGTFRSEGVAWYQP